MHSDFTCSAPQRRKHFDVNSCKQLNLIIPETVYDRCIATIEYKYKVGVALSEFAYTDNLQHSLAELTL